MTANEKHLKLQRRGKNTKRQETSSKINRDKSTIKALVLERAETCRITWQWRESGAIFLKWNDWWWTAAADSGAPTRFLPQWKWQRGRENMDGEHQTRHHRHRKTQEKYSSGLQFWEFLSVNAAFLNRLYTLHAYMLIFSYKFLFKTCPELHVGLSTMLKISGNMDQSIKRWQVSTWPPSCLPLGDTAAICQENDTHSSFYLQQRSSLGSQFCFLFCLPSPQLNSVFLCRILRMKQSFESVEE